MTRAIKGAVHFARQFVFGLFISAFAKSLVIAIHRAILARDPDPAALGAFVGSLRRSRDLTSLVSEILRSGQHREDSVVAQAQDLVRASYQGLLGRTPDPEGLQIHAARLAETHDLAALLASIDQSKEHWESSIAAHAQDLVRASYQGLLGRAPDPEGLQLHAARLAETHDLAALLAKIDQSEEHRDEIRAATLTANATRIYYGYSEGELGIIHEFANPEAAPEPGFVVDFMGGRVRTSSLWSHARYLDGQVTPLPIPQDHHSEAVEWISVLKAVRSARDRFVAMELGAGFGPWSVAGGIGARSRGIRDIHLYAVEADPLHFKLLQQNLEDNGFNPDQYTLVKAAVGTVKGSVRWPVLEDSRDDYGSRPLETAAADGAAGDYLGRRFENSIEIDLVPLHDLIIRESRWDLVHIDVQGSEVSLCQAYIDELCARVHWIVLGTHSRVIDGQMIELLRGAGWVLENEKPSKFNYNREASSLEAMTFVDGVQAWRNPMLDIDGR